jgi:uncharacterized protein
MGDVGENLPFSLMRADSMLAVADPAEPAEPSMAQVIREHLHITICG